MWNCFTQYPATQCKLADYSGKIYGGKSEPRKWKPYNSHISALRSPLSTIVSRYYGNRKRHEAHFIRCLPVRRANGTAENLAGAYHEAPPRDTGYTGDKIATMNRGKRREVEENEERTRKGKWREREEIKREKIKRYKEEPPESHCKRRERKKEERKKRDSGEEWARDQQVCKFTHDCVVRFGGAAGLSSPRVEKHVGSPAKEAHSYPGPHRADVPSIPSAFTCTHGRRERARARGWTWAARWERIKDGRRPAMGWGFPQDW